MSYEDQFSIEDHNRADGWAQELIMRHRAAKLRPYLAFMGEE